MAKVWRVAKNEYLNIVRTKAFVIGVVLMPVFMGGAIAVQKLTEDKVDISDRRFAVVDRTGALYETLRSGARTRHIHDEDKKQVRPRFLPEVAALDPAGLSDRVREGELFAYVVIGADVLQGEGEIAYHTQTPTDEELPKWIGQRLNNEIQRRRFETAGLDQELVGKLQKRTPLRKYGLAQVTASGEVKKAERVNELITYGVPAVSMFLLFMLVMMAAPQLLNTVLEEKMQRIAEILVSSVSPFELLLGKVLGSVFVSWTLAVLYLGGAAYLLHHFGFLSMIPLSIFLWFLFFQLMALLIFGSVFAAIGSACSELRDAQSLMGPAMLLVMLPMFVWFVVLRQPNSTFSTVVSLIPPVTPFLMMLRVAIPPGPALWELALGTFLTVAFMLACVWAAGRIFRIGILAQGQTPSFGKLIRWVVS